MSLLELLDSTASRMRIVNGVSVAMATWLSYDTLINFGDEVELIWKARWSLPKILYIIARYYGLVETILLAAIDTNHGVTTEFCKHFFGYSAISGPVGTTTTVNLIFILRLYALYDRSRKVLIFLGTLFIIELAGELYGSIKNTIISQAGVNPFGGCAIIPHSQIFTLTAWVPCLVVSLTFFVMTMNKLFLSLREHGPDVGWKNIFQIHEYLGPMLVLFMRDGSIFFALIFGSVFFDMFVVVYDNQNPYGLFAVTLLTPVWSFSGSRLILDLRRLTQQRKAATMHDVSIPLAFVAGKKPSDSEISDTDGSTTRQYPDTSGTTTRQYPDTNGVTTRQYPDTFWDVQTMEG